MKCLRVVDPETSKVVLLFSLRNFWLSHFGCRGILVLAKVTLPVVLVWEPVVVEVGAKGAGRPGEVVELELAKVRGEETVPWEGRVPRRDLMLVGLCPSRDLMSGVGLRAGDSAAGEVLEAISGWSRLYSMLPTGGLR